MEQYMALTRGDDKKKLLAGSINTWDFLEKAFIQKYRPPSKTTKELEEIHNFKQEIDDTLLDIPTRQMLDSQGPIPKMPPARALESIQDIADHSNKLHDGASIRQMSDSSDGIVAITNKLDCLLVVTCKSCHNLSRFGS
ncbi:hypothetical protein Tco_0849133 [Tanacetum coccineum]